MAVVIAECCANHNGSLDLLFDMVKEAADTGADVCKMQSQFTRDLTRREQFETGETDPDGTVRRIKRPYDQELERLEPLNLPDDIHERFIEACNSAGIAPMTTIFTRHQIPHVGSLEWDTVKVASPDCASYPMLSELMPHFQKIIVSTGMMNDHEIVGASDILGDHDFSFLHCVSIYPTPMDELHLSRMEWLRRFTPKVGFSDHSLVDRDGILASTAAIGFGAGIVERHFTILPRDQTRDGAVSINTEELTELVKFARMDVDEVMDWCESNITALGKVMGSANRELSHGELLNRDYYKGRFASSVDGDWVFNWEERSVTA